MDERMMDIYSKPGTLVRFAFPNHGYPHDQQTAMEHLVVGNVYHIHHTDVFSSYTNVYLVEVPEVSFNSVLFTEVSDNQPQRSLHATQRKRPH